MGYRSRGGNGRKWENMGEKGKKGENMGECERIWENMGEYGRKRENERCVFLIDTDDGVIQLRTYVYLNYVF